MAVRGMESDEDETVSKADTAKQFLRMAIEKMTLEKRKMAIPNLSELES